jgi:AGCS family alanine or glycine:cation symporter
MIISTIYTGDGPLANISGRNYHEVLLNAGLTQTNLVQYAVSSVSSVFFGNNFVAVCLLFFAFSTILSWNFFGKINFHYLFGKKAVVVYSTLSVCCIFLGTTVKSSLVWSLQDMLNQLMVLPNIIALFALSEMVSSSARK